MGKQILLDDRRAAVMSLALKHPGWVKMHVQYESNQDVSKLAQTAGLFLFAFVDPVRTG